MLSLYYGRNKKFVSVLHSDNNLVSSFWLNNECGPEKLNLISFFQLQEIIALSISSAVSISLFFNIIYMFQISPKAVFKFFFLSQLLTITLILLLFFFNYHDIHAKFSLFITLGYTI
jgi:hypothetical protein